MDTLHFEPLQNTSSTETQSSSSSSDISLPSFSSIFSSNSTLPTKLLFFTEPTSNESQNMISYNTPLMRANKIKKIPAATPSLDATISPSSDSLSDFSSDSSYDIYNLKNHQYQNPTTFKRRNTI
ncbi:hypothetical protein COBT_001843 [Conglomerata obtusa]